MFGFARTNMGLWRYFMLKFVITLPTYAQDAAAQMVQRWLDECLNTAEGVCYYKHPATVTSTGAFPDFILFTKTHQPLVIKIVSCELREIRLVEEEIWEIDDIVIDSPLLDRKSVV